MDAPFCLQQFRRGASHAGCATNYDRLFARNLHVPVPFYWVRVTFG